MLPDTDLRAGLRGLLDPDPASPLPPATVAAGVVVPLLDAGAGTTVVLTRRTEHLTRHPGEISFPGGIADDADASLAATALRELEEELGVAAEAVELLGALPPVHTVVSGVLITPFVGWFERRPEFRPDPSEIAEVLEFPLADLALLERPIELEHEGVVRRGFSYPVGDHVVWGATGQILHSLLVRLARDPA